MAILRFDLLTRCTVHIRQWSFRLSQIPLHSPHYPTDKRYSLNLMCIIGYLSPIWRITKSTFFETFGSKDSYRSTPDARNIHAPTEVLGIFAVETGFFFDADSITAVALRPAADTGSHGIGAVFVAFGYEVGLGEHYRPGAYQAHVAAQDIYELRQLVESNAPEDATAKGYVVLRVEVARRTIRRAILVHGAELQALKRHLVSAVAKLLEHDWSCRLKLDPNCDYDEQWRK